VAKLLIVDDHKDVLAVMANALSEAGYEVQTATTGGQAMAYMRSEKVDLLITDILMPDIDGIALIDAAIKDSHDVSILAISGGGPAQDGSDLLEAALMSGADAVLEKPFLPPELVRTVKALLR